MLKNQMVKHHQIPLNHHFPMVFLGFSHFPIAKMMFDLRWKILHFRVFQEADGSDALNDDTFGDATRCLGRSVSSLGRRTEVWNK